MENISVQTITIDGPAGAGKSTIAKTLAKRLQFAFLDTGAMYRALTLKALRCHLNLEDENQLVSLAKETHIDLESVPPSDLKVLLDGNDVSVDIRTIEVTNKTHYIARAPQVRGIMVKWQRQIGQAKNIVVEGRDAGTVIFPQATKKFYLDAKLEERCQRRFDELLAKGKTVDFEKLKEELQKRDQTDLTREVGPLKKAEDAIYIDSTKLSVDGVVECMLRNIKGEDL